MATISFLGPISRESIEVDIKTLKELKEILQKDNSLKDWLEICSIAINDELIFDIETQVSKNDKILILPPVCGG